MDDDDDAPSPLLQAKDHETPSVFRPANLLREGRRQRGRPDLAVPRVGLLDPDGDIVAYLASTGRASVHPGWACYHTTLHTFGLHGTQVGVVGHAVGAPFAVLVAEQLAASGCELLISVTSAGSIGPVTDPPHFVVIDRALRDEGTSHHYLPAGRWAEAPGHLLDAVTGALTGRARPVAMGATWTTDAPYRETPAAIARAAALGALAVEMEAAGLYAYARARRRDVLCVAHVTNTMAADGDDFEKGDHDGAADALDLVAAIIGHLAAESDT